MTDERYKKIMADIGMPNSRSLLSALQQVANEVAQERDKCSFMGPMRDCPTHGYKKEAAQAWRDALEDAANKFDGTTGYNWTAADGYPNAFDIAAELRYMATETPSIWR